MFLELRNIRKSYGAVRALDGADFTVDRGEIVGLCGENGAGKSTLVKTVAGGVRPDAGEIVVDGTAYSSLTPEMSAALGIGTVFQEFELIPSLAVYQNIFLGIEEHRGPFVDPRPMKRAARELLDRMGAPISVDAELGLLRTGHQQIVEIAKALARGSSMLILDEPTAALNAVEKRLLFQVLRNLREQDFAVMFISHFLSEIFEICDRVTIVRDGRTVQSASTEGVTEDDVINAMLGHRMERAQRREDASTGGAPVIELRAASKVGLYDHVDLTMRRGEIVGLAGPIGSGCYEVAETLFGIQRLDAGEVILHGQRVRLDGPGDAVRRRIGYVPEDRKGKGLLLNLGAATNVALPSLVEPQYSRAGWLRRRQIFKHFSEIARQLRLRPANPRLSASAFSGGGQQKLVIGRWLGRGCDAYVLVEPTRGVDVGAKAEIWDVVAALAAKGAAVLLVSTEAEDIVALCSRCSVMVRGRIVGELVGDEVTIDNIARLSTTSPPARESAA